MPQLRTDRERNQECVISSPDGTLCNSVVLLSYDRRAMAPLRLRRPMASPSDPPLSRPTPLSPSWDGSSLYRTDYRRCTAISLLAMTLNSAAAFSMASCSSAASTVPSGLSSAAAR
jgi:hypothetical protein